MKASNLLGLGVLGFGGYYLAQKMGWFTAPAAITPEPSGGTAQTPSVAPSSPAQVLTAADASTFPYSGSVTSDQMNSIGATINPQIAAGQIPSIAGGSVLAYMLGWGGQPTGTSKTVSGETYLYDGSNWNLQAVKTPDKSPLSVALYAAAVQHGNNPPLTVSQWNWILGNIVSKGASPVMVGPANSIDVGAYVNLIKDPASGYDTSQLTGNFGLAAYRPRTMTRAYRFNYTVKPRFA